MKNMRPITTAETTGTTKNMRPIGQDGSMLNNTVGTANYGLGNIDMDKAFADWTQAFGRGGVISTAESGNQPSNVATGAGQRPGLSALAGNTTTAGKERKSLTELVRDNGMTTDQRMAEQEQEKKAQATYQHRFFTLVKDLDGKTAVVPAAEITKMGTVRFLSNEEAAALYRQTGGYFAKFDSFDEVKNGSATNYAQNLEWEMQKELLKSNPGAYAEKGLLSGFKAATNEQEETTLQLHEELLAEQAAEKVRGVWGNAAESPIKTVGLAMDSGLSQAFTGLNNAFRIPATQKEAARQNRINEALQQVAAEERADMGVLQGLVFDFTQNVAQNAPAMMVGFAGGGLIGSAVTFAQTFGTDRYEMTKAGYDQKEVVTYAFFNGLNQAFLDYVGSMPGVGKVTGEVAEKLTKNVTGATSRFLLDLGIKGAGEGLTEYAQTYIEAGLKNAVLGQRLDGEAVSREALYSAMLGAFSAGVFDSVSTVADSAAVRAERTKLGNTFLNGEGGHTIQEALDIGLSNAKATDAYRAAAEIQAAVNGGKKVSAYQVGRMIYESQTPQALLARQMEGLTLSSAYANGVADDIAQTAAAVSVRTGRPVVFAQPEQMTVRGETGNYNHGTGVITLNARVTAEQAVDYILKHELTHSIEKTAQWGQLEQIVRSSLGADFEQMVADKQAEYAQRGIRLDDKGKGAVREVVADWIGQHLYREGFAAVILRGDAEIGSSFVQTLDRVRLALGGTKKSRSAANIAIVERLFLRAMQQQTAQNGRSDVQYNLDENFGQQLQDWLNGNGKRNGTYNGEYFVLGTTPDIFKKHGAYEGTVIMLPQCLEKITGGKHSISLDQIARLPFELNDPVLLFKGSVPNSFVALTELFDKQGNDVIVAVHINRYQNRLQVHRIASMYSKSDGFGNNHIEDYITQQLSAGNLLDASEKRAPIWFTSRGLQLPKLVQTIIDANTIKAQNGNGVNTQSMQRDGNYSSSSFHGGTDVDNYTGQEYNSFWESYELTDEFVTKVPFDERHEFLRSLANKTNGMKQGELKNIVIYTGNHVYFYAATGYMNGNIEEVSRFSKATDAKVKEWGGFNVDTGAKTFDSMAQSYGRGRRRNDWDNVANGYAKETGRFDDVDEQARGSDPIGYTGESDGDFSEDEDFVTGSFVYDGDGHAFKVNDDGTTVDQQFSDIGDDIPTTINQTNQESPTSVTADGAGFFSSPYSSSSFHGGTDVDNYANEEYNSFENTVADADKGRVIHGEQREETREAFHRRTHEEKLEVRQRGEIAFAFTRPDVLSPKAQEVERELTRLGVPRVVVDRLEVNKGGITTKWESEASTARGDAVYVNNSVSVDPKEVAGHEAFHFWAGDESRSTFKEILLYNIDFSSAKFKEFASKIQDDYFGDEIEVGGDNWGTLTEEILAHISGRVHAGDSDNTVRQILYDFDAVKSAWDRLVNSKASINQTNQESPTSVTADGAGFFSSPYSSSSFYGSEQIGDAAVMERGTVAAAPPVPTETRRPIPPRREATATVSEAQTIEELETELGEEELFRRMFRAAQAEPLPTTVEIDGQAVNSTAYMDELYAALPDDDMQLTAYLEEKERAKAAEIAEQYERGETAYTWTQLDLQILTARSKLEWSSLETGEDGKKTRRFFEQRLKGNDTNDSHQQELLEVLAGRSETYNPIANQKTLEKARGKLSDEEYKIRLRKRLLRYKPDDLINEVDAAAAQLLINEARTNGDLEGAADLIQGLSRKGTVAGRVIQVLSMQARMTPEGTLKAAQRLLRKESDRVLYDGANDDLDTLSETVTDAIERAESDKKRNVEYQKSTTVDGSADNEYMPSDDEYAAELLRRVDGAQPPMTREELTVRLAADIAEDHSPYITEREICAILERAVGESSHIPQQMKRVLKRKLGNGMGTLAQRIHAIYRAGHLNDVTMRRVFEEALELPQLTSKDVRTLITLTETMNDKADGTVEQAEAMEDIYRFLGEKLHVSKLDIFQSWRKFSMLFNLKTHMRNINSNAVYYGVNKMDNAITWMLERFIDPSERTAALGWRWTERGQALMPQIEASTEQALMKMRGQGKYEMGTGQLYQYRKPFGTSKGGEVLNKLNDWNSQLLENEDRFFFRHAYVDALGQAMVARGLTEVTTEVEEIAYRKAEEATFRAKNIISETLNGWKRWQHSGNPGKQVVGHALDVAVPFSKTPANIAIESVMHSPIGVAKVAYDIVQMTRGKNGKTTADIISEVSKTITGSVLFAVGILLGRLGLFTFGYGKNEKERAADELAGRQENSFQFGNVSISFDWLQPTASPIIVGASMADRLDEEGMSLGSVFGAVMDGTDSLFEMTMLQSLYDILGGYDTGATGTLGSLLENAISQSIPTVFGQVARAIDPVQRKATGESALSDVIGTGDFAKIVQRVMAKVPGLTYLLEPELDVWGNEVYRTGKPTQGNAVLNFFQQLVIPANIKTGTGDDDVSELVRLLYETSDEKMPGRALPSTITRETAAELGVSYEEANRLLGSEQYALVQELIHDGKAYEVQSDVAIAQGKTVKRKKKKYWSQMTEDERLRVLQRVYTGTKEAVEDPDGEYYKELMRRMG